MPILSRPASVRFLETFPEARPRIISDNGPQFVVKDFKAFIRVKGMDPVRTSPYYPESNGKLERWPACSRQAQESEVRMHSAEDAVKP